MVVGRTCRVPAAPPASSSVLASPAALFRSSGSTDGFWEGGMLGSAEFRMSGVGFSSNTSSWWIDPFAFKGLASPARRRIGAPEASPM